MRLAWTVAVTGLLLFPLVWGHRAREVREGEKVVREEDDEWRSVADEEDWDYFGEEMATRRRRGVQEKIEETSAHLTVVDSDSSEAMQTKSRSKRQSAIRINGEESTTRNSTGSLLVEDPPGIGLGHILGSGSMASDLSVCRRGVPGGPHYLHPGHQLQTVQDLPRLLHRGGTCLSKIQIVPG